jgi:hypothetical protein
MSLVPPQETVLGSLRIAEVLFEHDGPKLFVAVSKSKRLYLASLVDEDESRETYIYIPLSSQRLNMVMTGGVSIKEAFLSPEDGSVFRVTADYDADRNSIELLDATEIPVEYLPSDDSRLDLSAETRPHFTPEQLADDSVSERRSLLAVEVEPKGQARTELPLRSLSKLAGTLQDTIDALAQEESGKATARGVIQSDVLKHSELVFRESQAASFVLVAGSASPEALLASPILASACQRFVDLLEKGQSHDDLRVLVDSYGPRVRAKYRALLEALTDEETGITAFAAEPNGTLYKAGLKAAEVKQSLALLREAGQEVMKAPLEFVHLIGVNLRTGSFEIFDPQSKTKYSGYMDQDARRQIAGRATGTGHGYSAVILVQQQYPEIGEPTTTYRLTAIGEPFQVPTDEPSPSLDVESTLSPTDQTSS